MHAGLYARFRCGRLLAPLSVVVLLVFSSWSCRSREADWQELNDAAAGALSSGRSIEAEGYLRTALELARNKEPARVPLSLHRLARFYEARQRYGQAAEFYKQALDADTKRLEPDDADLRDTVKRLSAMYEQLEQLTEAKEVYKRFLAFQESALGKDALPIAATLIQIGRLSRMRSAYDEAEQSFQRALSIRILHLGQDNDELPEILDEYVALLRDTEQPYKADLMEERAANLRMKRTAKRIEQGN
jgi:tetratricopeptide (TPR) repeat protein